VHFSQGELEWEGEESQVSREFQERLSSWTRESNNKRRAHFPRGREVHTTRGGCTFQEVERFVQQEEGALSNRERGMYSQRRVHFPREKEGTDSQNM